MENLIDKTIEYVKDYFKNDASGHDYYHTLRVYKLARNIAEQENADIELTALIALLHDVDDCKLVGKDGELFKNVKGYLSRNNVDDETINLICSEISKISFKGDGKKCPETLEGKIAQDADRIDDLGAIGIARTFTYGGKIGRTIYSPEIAIRETVSETDYLNNSGTSIGHFYEKKLKLLELINTKEARLIAQRRTDYVLNYLKEFFEEWEGKA